MPYGIFKNSDSGKYEVYKVDSDGGKTNGKLGTHDSRADAQRQIAAIEANSNEKYIQKLSQAEAGYVTMPKGDLACANCRWFNNALVGYDACLLVANENPYPIVANGYCDEHRPYPILDEHYNPTGESLDPSEPIPLPTMDMGMMESRGLRGILAKLKARYGWTWLDSFLPSELPNDFEFESGGFKIRDDGRWMSWWTNNFKDLENEVISEYAIAEFIKSAKNGDCAMPELWWMHIPGTKHGITEKLFQVGHFALAVGRFDSEESNPLVKIFKKWYSQQKRITVSHGFMYSSDKFIDGVYHHIRTYEISSLKAGREANPYTKFEYPVEADKMALVTDTQRAEIEKEFGKATADYVVNLANEQGKRLEESGVAFKAKKPPFGMMEDDEEEEDGKPKKPKKAISDDTLLIMASNKQMADETANTVKNYAEQVDAGRKETKDLANRVGNLENAIGDVNDKMRRMTEYFGELTGKQPRASKSERTVVEKGDLHTDFIIEQNEKQATKEPIFNQMKSMNYGGNVVSPDFTNPNPNGHSE